MNNRLFVTMFLCALIALPVAAAQQTNSSSTAPSPASADQPGPVSKPVSQDFWDGDEPSLGALLFHPFANKEYVRRHVQPIRDRVSELEELTDSAHKQIRDVDARVQQGIQMASAKASLADEHATGAAGKAQMAHQTATALDTRVAADETVVGNIDQYKPGAQTEILFRPGQTVLSKQAKDALDEIAAQVKDQHGYILEVQGFASGRGQAAIANSRKMADSVERYLVLNHEIPAYRIYVIGMGTPMGGAPVAQRSTGTRVEVSLLKTDLQASTK